jgi:hypothetical protein
MVDAWVRGSASSVIRIIRTFGLGRNLRRTRPQIGIGAGRPNGPTPGRDWSTKRRRYHLHVRPVRSLVAITVTLLVACASQVNLSTHRKPVRKALAYEVVAGDGVSGHTGDGGLAVRAALLNPDTLAIGPDGSLYITEVGAIRRVTSNGRIETVAGTGKPSKCADQCGSDGDGGFATEAMVSPSGVAVDSVGTIYFSDPLRATVRTVTRDGRVERFAGSGGPGCPSRFQTSSSATSEPLCAPYDVAVDRFGDVLIAGGSDLWIAGRHGGIGHVAGPAFTPESPTTLHGYPSIVADLHDAARVLVSDEGFVYVVDTGLDRVVRIDPTGRTDVAYSSPWLLDAALDTAGALYVAVGGGLFSSSASILRVESPSRATPVIPPESGIIGSETQPLGIVFDSEDRLLVAMSALDEVVRFALG